MTVRTVRPPTAWFSLLGRFAMTFGPGKRIALLLELERPLFGQVVRQVVPLSSEVLEDCLQEQRRVGGQVGLGQIMRARGLITRAQIGQVLQLQARWVARALRGDLGDGAFPYRTFLSVCLPAYNEAANIEDTLDAACAMLPEFLDRFEVVVVDDGSQDDTGAVVTHYSQRDPRVRLVRHEINRGYGAAVSSGLRAARGDLVFFTDADGQFSLLDLPQFLVRLRDHDAVIGYRYRRADPWHRRFNAWSWNRLIRCLLGVRVRDLDCAFKLFRRELVERLHLTSSGAAINAEILVQCFRGGVRLCELPVAHYPRCHGAPTGAAFRVILRAFRELPQLWKYRRPVAGPLLPAVASSSASSLPHRSGEPMPHSLVKSEFSAYDLNLDGYSLGERD
jgi:hypothetical protein